MQGYKSDAHRLSAERIHAAVDAHGHTHPEAAAACGVGQSTFVKWYYGGRIPTVTPYIKAVNAYVAKAEAKEAPDAQGH